MKLLKAMTCFGLTAVMILQATIPALAGDEIPEGYDAGQWEQLTDNYLEYHEIEDRIVHFSDSYLSAQYELSKNYSAYETAANALEGTIKDSRSALKDARKEGDEVGIAYNQAILGAEEDAKKSLDKVAKIIRGSTDRILNNTVKGSLVMNTENLMIAYHRLVYAMELLDSSVILAESAYQSSLTQKHLGLATDADVLAAQESLLSARLQQQTTGNQLIQIKQNLHMLTGWQYDAEVTFGAIPDPDQDRILAMDPDRDVEKAIGNNYTLSDLRHTSASGAAEKRNRLEQMGNMEEQIKTGVNLAYLNVLQAQAAFGAAADACESAGLTFEAAGRQYRLGIFGELQYQQMEVLYLAEKMNYENARLDLFQAMETYDRAIDGQLSIE